MSRTGEVAGDLADSGVRPAEPQDGRVSRGRRTRTSVMDALLDLVGEGNPRPTAPAMQSGPEFP